MEDVAKLLTTGGPQLPFAYFISGSILLRNVSGGQEEGMPQEYAIYKRGPLGWYQFETIKVTEISEGAFLELLMKYELMNFEDMANPWTDFPIADDPIEMIDWETWKTYVSAFEKYRYELEQE